MSKVRRRSTEWCDGKNCAGKMCDCVRDELAQKDRELERARKAILDHENDCACLPEDRSVTEYVGGLRRELEQAKADRAAHEEQATKYLVELEQSRQREVDLKEALGTANFTIEQRKAGEAELRERLVAANKREAAKDAVLGRVKAWTTKVHTVGGTAEEIIGHTVHQLDDLDTILADVPEVLALFDTNGHGEIKIGPIREPATIIVLRRDESEG